MLKVGYLLQKLGQADWPDGESVESIEARLAPADLERLGQIEMNILKVRKGAGMLSLKIRQEDGTLVGILKHSIRAEVPFSQIDAFVAQEVANGNFIKMEK